jgi:hypothetical protein
MSLWNPSSSPYYHCKVEFPSIPTNSPRTHFNAGPPTDLPRTIRCWAPTSKSSTILARPAQIHPIVISDQQIRLTIHIGSMTRRIMLGNAAAAVCPRTSTRQFPEVEGIQFVDPVDQVRHELRTGGRGAKRNPITDTRVRSRTASSV